MIFLRKGCRPSRLNVLEQAEVGVDARKLLVLFPMWLSFLIGCIAGAYLETHIQIYALLVPAGVTFGVGLSYMLFRQRLKGYVKRLEQQRLSSDVENMKGTLARAHGFLRELSHHQEHLKTGTDEVEENLVIELEEELETMLETMREVEENIESMRSFYSEDSRPSRHRSFPPASV